VTRRERLRLDVVPQRYLLVAIAGAVASTAMPLLAGAVAHVSSGYPWTWARAQSFESFCRDPEYPTPEVKIRAEGLCSGPAASQSESATKKCVEWRVAVRRRDLLAKAVSNGDTGARRAWTEEKTELERLEKDLRDLMGSPLLPDALLMSLGIALTCLALLAALVYLDRQATRSVTVGGDGPSRTPPGETIKPARGELVAKRETLIRKYVLVLSACIGLFAVIINALENFSPYKVDFDASSYCLGGSYFLAPFLGHLPLLGMSYIVSLPLACGWYVTQRAFVPSTLSKEKYRWGVGAYMAFMERWAALTIVFTGAITASWARALSRTPGSAKLQIFLGAGAVVACVLLIVRIYRNSLLLRERYEHEVAHLAGETKLSDLPADPTEGFLGDGWKVPATLAAAFGIVYQLFELSGVAKLFGGP
jgi:hypothetical protein